MKGEKGQTASCCPTCGAPFAPKDDLGDVIKCSHCGNEVIRKVSFEDRIAMVAFKKILREGKMSKTAWFVLSLLVMHVSYISFRWALSSSATGAASWVAWGCAIYSGVAIISFIVMFFTRRRWDDEGERKIFERCDWSIEKFRTLAKDPKSKIGWMLRRNVEDEYQTVKKWMS